MTPDAVWLQAAVAGLGAGALLALAVWARSLRRRDVSIVDSAWGFLVLVPALVVAALLPADGPRAAAVLGLAGAWALRLSVYISRRHRGLQPDGIGRHARTPQDRASADAAVARSSRCAAASNSGTISAQPIPSTPMASRGSGKWQAPKRAAAA